MPGSKSSSKHSGSTSTSSKSTTSTERGRRADKVTLKAIWKKCSSITFRPKTLEFENKLMRVHIGLSILAGILTIVAFSSALLYRKAYKHDHSSDATGKIPQEQGRLMGWSQDSWILALFNWLLCFGSALFECISQNRVNAESSANRKGLKRRFIAYIVLGLGVLIGYFYLAVVTWNNGSHAEVKSWPKRRVPKYKNKGTSKQKQIGWEVKKVLQITHPECTENTLSYCSEIKQFNYSLIAATALLALLLMEMCYVVFCAYRASKRKQLNSLFVELNAGKDEDEEENESNSRSASRGRGSGGRGGARGGRPPLGPRAAHQEPGEPRPGPGGPPPGAGGHVPLNFMMSGANHNIREEERPGQKAPVGRGRGGATNSNNGHNDGASEIVVIR